MEPRAQTRVCSKDGGTSLIYQNGALWHSGSTSAAIGLINQAAFGASDPTGSSSYFGLLDDVAVYNRALTPAEIASRFAALSTKPVRPGSGLRQATITWLHGFCSDSNADGMYL